MHAEKKFADSRLLFSLPTVLYNLALQLKGFLTQLCLVMPINRSLFWARVMWFAISFGNRPATVGPVVPLVGEK